MVGAAQVERREQWDIGTELVALRQILDIDPDPERLAGSRDTSWTGSCREVT